MVIAPSTRAMLGSTTTTAVSTTVDMMRGSETNIACAGAAALATAVVASGVKRAVNNSNCFGRRNTRSSVVSSTDSTTAAAGDNDNNDTEPTNKAMQRDAYCPRDSNRSRPIDKSHSIETELKSELGGSYVYAACDYIPIDIRIVKVGDKVSVDRRVALGWDGGDAIVTKAYQPPQRDFAAHICVKVNGKGRALKVVHDLENFPACRHHASPHIDSNTSNIKRQKLTPRVDSAAATKTPTTSHKTNDWSDDAWSDDNDWSDDASSDDASSDDDNNEFNFYVNPFIGDSTFTFRVKVSANAGADDNDLHCKSYDMLLAVLCKLGPQLTTLHKALPGTSQQNQKNAYNAGLRWAWSRNNGFSNVMKNIDSAMDLQKKSRGAKTDFSPVARDAFAKLIATAKRKSKGLKLQRRFCIKISQVNKPSGETSAQSRADAKSYAKKKTIHGATSEQRDAQYDAMLEAAVYSLGDFVSYNAYGRGRENMFEERAGASRRVIKRSKNGHAITAGPTLKRVKEERETRVQQLKIKADLTIMQDTESGSISLCSAETLPPANCTRIGIVHDLKSWLSLVIRVMVSDDECALNLSKPEGGCLDTFTDTYLILWGDGFPAASRNAGNMCWTLVDPSHRLFPSGRSRPIPAALWHGHEDILINLLEQSGASELGSDQPQRVSFAPFDTWIDVALPLRGFSADHKMWGELTGTISSGGHRRLHWLQPWTSIFLANDVETFANRNLNQSVEWRVRTLHNSMAELKALLSNPDTFDMTRLKRWLSQHNLAITGKKADLVQRIKEATDNSGASLWTLGANWSSVIADCTETDPTKRWLPESKVLSVLAACNSATGVINFPVLAADNPHTFDLMTRVAARLLGSDDDVANGAAREYLGALLTLDHISGTKRRKEKQPNGNITVVSIDSRRSLRFRSQNLEQWLREGGPNPSTGCDLSLFQNFLGIDHDAKYIGQKFVQAVILHNKSAAKRAALKLDTETVARIESNMLRQMKIGCFKNFCYGWHYELLFYSVLDTFAGCAPAIILFALFIAQSNLWRRKRSRASADHTRPELSCSVKTNSDGELIVTPVPTYGNDRVEVAKAHAVEFCIPTMFGILSNVSTLSMYFASHRWAPFMVAEKLVTVVSDYGEFRGEQANKQPKETARLSGNHWTHTTMERCSMQQIMKWMRRFTKAGPIDTELNGEASPPSATSSKPRAHGEDRNPTRNAVAICPCVYDCAFECRHCRRDENAAFGAIASDDLRTVDEDDDPTASETPIVDSETEDVAEQREERVEYATVSFDDLHNDMYIEVKWDRQWCPAFVESVSSDEVKLYYLGPPPERDTDTRTDFDSSSNEARHIVRGRTPPSPPWASEVHVQDFTPTTASDGDDTRTLQYESDAQTLGGKPLPRTVPEQLKRNLMCSVKDIIKKLGEEYVYRCGQCYVIGAAAMSQRLLNELRLQVGRTESDDSGEAMSEAVGVPFQTALPLGDYMVRVDSETPLVLHVTGTNSSPGCSRNGTRRRQATPQKFEPETEYTCHVVEVERAVWQKFMRGDDQACIDARTNGATPLLACVCSVADNARCPGSATNIHLIPTVLRDMERPLTSSPKWKLEQSPMLNSIVGDCIHYQYRRCFLTPAQQQAERSTVQAEVTAETVYETLQKHGGEEWMAQQFGTDTELTLKRLSIALVAWLQDEVDGKRSRRQQSTLERDLRHAWATDPPAAVFFRGQKVRARYTKANGALDVAQNAGDLENKGFRGTIVAAGEPGFWRVAFEGESDHPGIPHINPANTVCIFPVEL